MSVGGAEGRLVGVASGTSVAFVTTATTDVAKGSGGVATMSQSSP